ncbi:MAG: anaerobic ribonucleoside-triphosphate reductase [Gammaproteobacteria bacterium]|jgi:hypothetical protein
MTRRFELRDEERQRCEVWTRVMGYHRPVSAFNAGKQAEHAERLHYREERCGLDLGSVAVASDRH